MGRKAMPIDLLLVKGNKNLTKKEIEARKKAEKKLKPNSDNIKAPTILNAKATALFNKLAKESETTTGLITNVDVEPLAAYCWAYTLWGKMTKGEKLDGRITYNFKDLDILFKQWKSLAIEFGFTPSSRAKLAIPIEEEKEKTPEEKMFGDI